MPRILKRATFPLSAQSTPHYIDENIPFPPQRNDGPIITILIRLLVHLGRERDGTHDPIPELLIQNRLVRIPIILHNLIQPINQRFLGRHVHRTTPIRKATQLLLEQGLRNPQDRGELLDIFGGGLGLAVEDGRNGDFIATEVLGDLLEGQLPAGFGAEEDTG